MKKLYSSITIFFVFTLIFTFFVGIKSVFAQGAGVKLSPVIMEEVVEPGQSIVREILIRNVLNESRMLYGEARDFVADGESGKPLFTDTNLFSSWIDITSSGIEFGPREEKSISFRVTIPKEAGPGGYYAAVLFSTKPGKANIDSEEKGAAMTTSQQVGCLLLFRVKGEIFEEATIREFTTDKGLYSTPFKVDFDIRIENTGNVHVRPLGSINITNMFGKEVEKITFNEPGSNILPSSIRSFENDWSGKFGFGKYKASLGLIYGTAVSQGGQGNQSSVSEVEFWIIPWKIVTPLILGLIFLIAIFTILLKLYKNKAVKKAMQRAGINPAVLGGRRRRGSSPTVHLGLILFVVFLIFFLIVVMSYFLFFA